MQNDFSFRLRFRCAKVSVQKVPTENFSKLRNGLIFIVDGGHRSPLFRTRFLVRGEIKKPTAAQLALSYGGRRWSRGGYLAVFSMSRNAANKNTHCCHNGHIKPRQNTQASSVFCLTLIC